MLACLPGNFAAICFVILCVRRKGSTGAVPFHRRTGVAAASRVLVRFALHASRLVRRTVVANLAFDRGHQIVDADHQRPHLPQRFVLMQHRVP